MGDQMFTDLNLSRDLGKDYRETLAAKDKNKDTDLVPEVMILQASVWPFTSRKGKITAVLPPYVRAPLLSLSSPSPHSFFCSPVRLTLPSKNLKTAPRRTNPLHVLLQIEIQRPHARMGSLPRHRDARGAFSKGHEETDGVAVSGRCVVVVQ